MSFKERVVKRYNFKRAFSSKFDCDGTEVGRKKQKENLSMFLCNKRNKVLFYGLFKSNTKPSKSQQKTRGPVKEVFKHFSLGLL